MALNPSSPTHVFGMTLGYLLILFVLQFPHLYKRDNYLSQYGYKYIN